MLCIQGGPSQVCFSILDRSSAHVAWFVLVFLAMDRPVVRTVRSKGYLPDGRLPLHEVASATMQKGTMARDIASGLRKLQDSDNFEEDPERKRIRLDFSDGVDDNKFFPPPTLSSLVLSMQIGAEMRGQRIDAKNKQPLALR